jgi:hypothetical protein
VAWSRLLLAERVEVKRSFDSVGLTNSVEVYVLIALLLITFKGSIAPPSFIYISVEYMDSSSI